MFNCCSKNKSLSPNTSSSSSSSSDEDESSSKTQPISSVKTNNNIITQNKSEIVTTTLTKNETNINPTNTINKTSEKLSGILKKKTSFSTDEPKVIIINNEHLNEFEDKTNKNIKDLRIDLDKLIENKVNNIELNTTNNNKDINSNNTEQTNACSDSVVDDIDLIEPPKTPVGKDELALRRHRFFSDILTSVQTAIDNKSHFQNHLGPDCVTEFGEELSNKTAALDSIITRLETVTNKLEDKVAVTNSTATSTKITSVDTFTQVTPQTSSPLVTSPIHITMSVAAFNDIVSGPFSSYLQLSNKIGGDVAVHAKLVSEAFQAQQQYLVLASQSKEPSQNDKIKFLQPTSDKIAAIQELREKNRTSPFFNHLSAISESIPALGWVTVVPTPAPYVKEMNDAGQFYTNRVLKDWKEKDKTHVEWTKSWVETLSELQKFIRQYHTTGLVWSGSKVVSAGGSGGPPPPPPGGMPPPPPILSDFGDLNLSGSNDDRSALFAQINKGADITKGLKKVTSDMQTHKNKALAHHGSVPAQAAHNSTSSVKSPPVNKPPVFARDGKKWLIEYQKDNPNLVVEGAEMNNVVYMFNCVNSTLVVKGKINSVFMDSCKKSSVVFDSLVSSMEFVNCQSVQMQVLGKVPTISIDKSDGCQMYLSPESLDVEIVSSKSSEMNVLVPRGNGDYTEYPIPEQYKTTVSKSGLKTTIVESKG